MSNTILVKRHAEKSSDPLDPHLTEAGRARVQRLVDYIPKRFGSQPKFLFAAAASKHSQRPIETLEPLGAQYHLKIDSTYADQDYGALAHHLRHLDDLNDVLTVVCWHHGNIPNLANALRAAAGDYPDPWKRDVFNLILKLDLTKKDEVPTIERISQPF